MTKLWLSAFRLRTLPLSLSSIGMGGFLAAAQSKFNITIFLLCCSTTIFLQILSNVANDFGDTINGADHAQRIGPMRVVQSGAISKNQMKGAIYVFALASFASGILLLYVSLGWNSKAFLFFLGLGVLSIAAAVAYTVGKRPYGYCGLGDFSVLIFFGLIGVIGSQYLFTKTLSAAQFLPALSCGFFSIAVLNINNIRDIESDRLAGKYSIPVRIGKTNATYYHWILLLGGLLCAFMYVILNFNSPWQFLFVLAAPLLIVNGKSVAALPSEKLDPFLKQMALTTLLFVFLFGIGELMR